MGNSIAEKHSKSALRISVPDDEEMWERVIDFTEIKKEGLLLATVLSGLRKLNKREFR